MVEQFDRLWHDMLDEFDLHDNDQINSMYEKRDKFCQVFFRDIFMAGMRSTQRCDGMNKDFKLVLSISKNPCTGCFVMVDISKTVVCLMLNVSYDLQHFL